MIATSAPIASCPSSCSCSSASRSPQATWPAELEISERTARRDLEALGVAGLPVYSLSGRNGGWRLEGGGRTDLSGLSATEAQALFMVAGPQAGTTPEVKAALRKLVRALAGAVPRGRRTGRRHHRGGPARMGRHRAVAANAVVPRRGARRRRPGCAARARVPVAHRRGVRSGHRAAGPGREGRALVPRGRHRCRAAHVPRRPRAVRAAHRRRRHRAAPGSTSARRGRSSPTGWRSCARRWSPEPGSVATPWAWWPGCWASGCASAPRSTTNGWRSRRAATTCASWPVGFSGFGAVAEVIEPQELRDELLRLGRDLVARYGS